MEVHKKYSDHFFLPKQGQDHLPNKTDLHFPIFLFFIQGLDGLVNNAGIGMAGLIEWTPIDTMKKIFEVNYWGLVRVTKAMLPLLKKSRDGRIVNVTSILGQNLLMQWLFYLGFSISQSDCHSINLDYCQLNLN